MKNHKPKHIVIDIKKCKTPLDDTNCIRTFIIFICRSLNLARRGPVILDDFGGKPNGITAIQILESSSLSIHTYPEHNSCNIDIFACCDFNAVTAFKLCLAFFGGQGNFQLIERSIV